MSNFCPNTNSQEWKDLVEYFQDPGIVRFVYSLNNGEIPTLERAKELVENANIYEADDKDALTSEELKLKKAKEQLDDLDAYLDRPGLTKGQIETLEKFISMTEKHIKIIEENIELEKQGLPTIDTASVSSFIGASDFKGDPSKYKGFKLFGIFMHEVVEAAQKIAVDQNIPISKVLDDRSIFDDILEKYMTNSKTAFHIEGFTDDAMYEAAKDFVNTVKFNSRYLLIPELTIIGSTPGTEITKGTTIVGRIDLLVVDPDGVAKPLDFKTKKVTGSTNIVDNTMDIEKVIRYLSSQEFPVTSKMSKNGVNVTLPALSNGNRTAFDTWTLQLKMYQNIMAQNDILVAEGNVYALLYQPDPKGKKPVSYMVHTFDNNDYYADAATILTFDNAGAWKSTLGPKGENLKGLKEKIDEAVPMSEDMANQVEEREFKILDFNVSYESDKFLKERLEAAINAELDDIRRQLNELQKQKQRKDAVYDERLEEILKTRRKTLIDYRSIVDNSTLTDLRRSANFTVAMNTIESDLKDLETLSNQAIIDFRSKSLSDNNKELIQIVTVYNKSRGMSEVVTALEQIVDEARQENPANIKPELLERIANIRLHNERIEANYREVSLASSIFVIQSLGKNLEKAGNEMYEARAAELQSLYRELELLNQGKGSGIFKKIKHSTLAFMSKNFKKKMEEELGPNGATVISQREALEIKIKAIEMYLRDGLDFSYDGIAAYINGITDPNAAAYIGAGDAVRNGSFLDSFGDTALNPMQFVASASSSERAVSSVALLFKNTKNDGEQQMMNDLLALNFDALRDNMLRSYSVEELNNLISEWRTTKVFDKEKQELVDKTQFYLTKPSSEAYDATYQNYNSELRGFEKEIAKLKSDYNKKFAVLLDAKKNNSSNLAAAQTEADEARDQILAKINERDVVKGQYIDWLVENARTPYTDVFYNTQRLLPAEIRDELQKLYLEKEYLAKELKGQGASAEVLDLSTFDTLAEIEVEIKKLREKAKEMSPEYANAMDQLKDLYEFEVDQNYFERAEKMAISAFANHPDLLEKWYKNNTVDKPTDEWYAELERLYNLRAEIFGSNPRMKELIDAKNRILRPHKIAGRIDSRFLNKDEVESLDEIYTEMDAIIESTPALELPDTIREASIQISNEIKAISEKRLSSRYQDAFNEKYKALTDRLVDVRTKEIILDKKKKEGAPAAEITQAENDYNTALKNFNNLETEFATWFNNNHEGTYVSIAATPIDLRTNRKPKRFNLELVPTAAASAQYMQKGVPHPKYGLRVLKPEVNNPDFLEFPDGIPVPKALSKDANGNYFVTPGYENSDNVNTNFKKIASNPELYNFYNTITNYYFKTQSSTKGKKIGYRSPGFAASKMENLAKHGLIKSMGKGWDQYVDKYWKAQSQQDLVENTFGDLKGEVRMRYTQQLDRGMQSEDIISSVIKYALEANYNIAMQRVTPKVDAYISYLETLSGDLKTKIQAGTTSIVDPITGKREAVDMAKRQRQLDKIIEQIKFERRKFAYGQEESSNEASRRTKKIVNQIFAITSFARMGFDVANQMKNMVSGNIQAFIASGGLKSNHYGADNLAFAKRKLYKATEGGVLRDFMADWGKLSDLHETTMLVRMINPTQKDFMSNLKEASGGPGRRKRAEMLGVQEFSYLLQDAGETEVAITVMYAIMDNYKYKMIESRNADGTYNYKKNANGEIIMVPAHEAYVKDPNTNQLVIKSDVEYTKEDEKYLRNIIYSEMRRAQGNYAKDDMTKMEETVFGKMMFFYRKYLIPTFTNRFGYLRPNWEAGEAAMGYWTATGKALRYFSTKDVAKHFILGTKLAKKFGADLNTITIYDPKDLDKPIDQRRKKTITSDFYERKIVQARRDAIVMSIFAILSSMILEYVASMDDDDEEVGFLLGNALRVFWGVKGETLSMFPIGGGSDEYIRNFTSLTVFTREFNALSRTGEHSWNLVQAMLYNGGVEPDPEYDGYDAYDTWKDAFYTRNVGNRFEKGDPKLIKDIQDFTGLRNFLDFFDPSDRVDQLKKNQ